MRWSPIPIVDGSYSDDTKPFSAQDTVNYIPVSAEQAGGRSSTMLRGVPGLVSVGTPDAYVAEVGSYDDSAGPHRGARNVEGRLFVVVGQGLYQVDSNENFSARLGVVPGRSRVSMTHNQIAGGNQVVIGNGSAGFVYNTVTAVFSTITDSGFPGFLICDFINQLVVGVEPQRRYFFNSDIADATAYNALETYESEASPDRLRSLIVDHREVWLLNERTVEVFDNTGVTNALFENKRIVIEQGCAATHSVQKIDNSVIWLNDKGQLVRANGYTPQRISTHAMEQDIARCNLSKAFALKWEDRGHAVYYITFPDGHTWGYDCATGKIHRRKSRGMERWRLNTLVQWNDAWYGGAYNSGVLYRLDWDYLKEGNDELVSERITGVLHDNQNRVTVNAVEIVFDTGGATSDADDHYAEIAISKDGGQNWGSFTQHSLGRVGAFLNRITRRRLGSARHWTLRVRVSSPQKRDLIAASIQSETEH